LGGNPDTVYKQLDSTFSVPPWDLTPVLGVSLPRMTGKVAKRPYTILRVLAGPIVPQKSLTVAIKHRD